MFTLGGLILLASARHRLAAERSRLKRAAVAGAVLLAGGALLLAFAAVSGQLARPARRRRAGGEGVPLLEARALLERVDVELSPGGDGLLAGEFTIGDVTRSDAPRSDEATKLALCGAEHLAGVTWAG